MKKTHPIRKSYTYGCLTPTLMSCIGFASICFLCFVGPTISVLPEVNWISDRIRQRASFSLSSSKSSDMIAFSCMHGNYWGSSLYTVHADGSHLRVLRTSSSQRHRRLSWSPNGVWIAFHTETSPYDFTLKRYFTWTYEGGNEEIFSIRFDGTARKQITYNHTRDSDPRWSHDGASIFFRGENGLLYQALWETGDIRSISTYPIRLFDLSPDNRWIAFNFYRGLPAFSQNPEVSNSIDFDAIYRMNLDGSGLQVLKHVNSNVRSSIQWAPNSGYLLYHNDNGRPFVFNTTTQTEDFAPKLATDRASWSPDSRWIAMIGGNSAYMENGKWLNLSNSGNTSPGPNVYVLDISTGQLAEVVKEINPEGVSWSPDSEWIAFSSLSQDNQLFKIKRDGTGLQQLTDLDCRISEISWSPK